MSQKNPWKTCSTRIVYENPWFSVREDQVIRPDGQAGTYSVVSSRVATGVVALTPQHECYLVGQFRYPMNEYSWEIIEGGADAHETPLAAAQRELREEAGLLARDWSELGGEIHLSNCFTSEVGRLFLATNLTETNREPDGTEVLEIRKLPFSECMALVARGEIKDALTIIALHRAYELLHTIAT